MKVFVDTSVWINYLKGHRSDKARKLFELIETGQSIYTLPIIIQEILQGFKNEKDVAGQAEKFGSLNILSFEFDDAIEAARLYRVLRKSGITSSTVDLQIVTVCLRHDLHLLTEDGDFTIIAAKLDSLKLG